MRKYEGVVILEGDDLVNRNSSVVKRLKDLNEEFTLYLGRIKEVVNPLTNLVSDLHKAKTKTKIK